MQREIERARPVTVHAEKRGCPIISLADGGDIAGPGQGESGSPAKVLAAADLDNDGVQDLAVADGGGTIKLYRGNDRARRFVGTAVDADDADQMFAPGGVSNLLAFRRTIW